MADDDKRYDPIRGGVDYMTGRSTPNPFCDEDEVPRHLRKPHVVDPVTLARIGAYPVEHSEVKPF